MKKISIFILSLIICLCGVIMSACGEDEKVELKLSRSAVIIYYDNSGDNTEVVNVVVSGAQVNALGLRYDNTNIKINSSKKDDGSFDLSISPKSKITTSEITVLISAGGKAEARLSVMVVVPVERVTARENQYIVFNSGERSVYPLFSNLTFYPDGAGEFDVEYQITNADDFGGKASIIDGQIILEKDFNSFDKPINILASVVGEGISVPPTTVFDVKVIPNVKGLASLISMAVNYNGVDGATLNADGYELKINNGTLEDFVISVKIPKNIGVGVDVDRLKDEQNNIMQYLTCNKTTENSGDYSVSTFVFDALESRPTTAVARLYFKFYYLDNSDENLSNDFVICGSGKEVLNYLDVGLVVPLERIDVSSDVDIFVQDEEEYYVIFKNYNSELLRFGSAFKFLTYPRTASNKTFVIYSLSSDISLGVILPNGNYEELGIGSEITADTNVYILAKSTAVEGITGNHLTLVGKEEQESNVSLTINFRVENGTSGLFIVDRVGEVPEEEYSVEGSTIYLAAEVNDNLNLILYAPNAEKSQLKYESIGGDIEISTIVGQPSYFNLRIDTSKAGEINKTITKSINTLNGYTLTLNITIIQRILESDVKAMLAPTSQNLSVIGELNSDYLANGISQLKLKRGGSVELEYSYTEGALKPRVVYSYINAPLGTEDYPSAYSDAYKQFYLAEDGKLDYDALKSLSADNFVSYCLVVSSQNLSNRNLLTGLSQGKVIVRVDIIGKTVEGGRIKDADPITKFMLIEVYNPVTEIIAVGEDGLVRNVIELRAKNLVNEEDVQEYQITLNMVAKSSLADATYSNIYLDNGTVEQDEQTENKVLVYDFDDNGLHYAAKLDVTSNQLTITLYSVPNDFVYPFELPIKVFAFDFGEMNYIIGTTHGVDSVKNKYPTVQLELPVIPQETKLVEDITVKSLKELNKDNALYNTFNEEHYKIYEEIYIDSNDLVNGSDNLYRIVTEISPINAYNKNLIYRFVNATGTSETLVTIPLNDGVLHMGANQGGRGYIEITAESGIDDLKTVIIPIKIADGSSFETAFEITDITKIKNPTKHYILTGGKTYEIDSLLLDGATFTGGLYGRRSNTDAISSIKLNGKKRDNESIKECSLFSSIGAGGIVKDLIVYGVSNNGGMIANSNAGTIENVNVTTYIQNRVYVPSVVFVPSDKDVAGGIVATNAGTITNCTFAGSIVAAADGTYGGIYGVSTGSVSDCTIIVAKFQYTEQTRDRLILDNGNHINGIKKGTISVKFVAQDGANKYSYDDEGREPLDNVYVKTFNGHSLGKENADYGIVFYYKAVDISKQSALSDYNKIQISDLISANGNDVKVISNSTIASVYGDVLDLSGIGEFSLSVFSIYDYTNSATLNLISMYYFDGFKVYNNVKTLTAGTTINMLKGAKEVIYTSTKTFANDVELVENDFEVIFNMFDNDDKTNPIDGNFVTNNSLGAHSINATWENDGYKYLFISLNSEFEAKYDALIAENFVNNYHLILSIYNGTTEIVVDKSIVEIEPKDSAKVTAIITTDAIEEDGGNIITTDTLDDTIIILRDDGLDVTSYFDVNVIEQQYLGNNQFAFDIYISLKQEYRHYTSLVDKNYTVKVYSKSKAGDQGSVIYPASATFGLFIQPQSISSINAEMFIVGNSIKKDNKTYYSISKNAVSSIKPSDLAVLEINLFPNYASFDYIDIISTSNTFAGFAYVVQQLTKTGEYTADPVNVRKENLPNVNGVRLYNSFAYNENATADIGTYYLLIYTKNELDQNAVVYTQITPYYKGEEVEGATTFITYISVPQSPEINVDGKTYTYAYPGQQISVDVSISSDQTLEGGIYEIKNTQGTTIINQSNISCRFLRESGGYKYYTISFTVLNVSGYVEEYNKRLTLYVKSCKIDRGEIIYSNPSTFDVYVSEFLLGDNAVSIMDVNEGKFNVSSIRPKELKIITNLIGKADAIESFNDYYYFVNTKTGFEVGYFDHDTHAHTSTSGVNLAGWLYYIGDYGYSNIGVIKDGKFTPKASAEYGDYVSFIVDDGKLYAVGGDRKGDIPMLLTFYYKMPDGREFVYNYTFTIVNGIYTTEDMPLEISDSEAFLRMNETEEPNDYILSNDIYLYEYDVIQDTPKIKSLDGNNYTINIMSFKEPEGTIANFALFNSVLNGTTLKNITVNYYYLDEIVFDDLVTTINFAGIALNNSGVIYNCEVMAFNTGKTMPTFNTYGIKITSNNTNVNVAGFVLNNSGSVTNSRVGGTSKLVSSFDYSKTVMLPTLKEVEAKSFVIKAPGTVSGFVQTNTGVIASSFVKNASIINTYAKNETKTTSGFATENSGDISMSYAEGGKSNVENVSADIGGVEGTGVLAGFVYLNNGNISDSYSNMMLRTSNNQVGRLGAGFVYYNNENALIERAHSLSKIAGNNTSQLNFIGVNDNMEYNNDGIVKNCYYYYKGDESVLSTDDLYNTDIRAISNVSVDASFYGYNFGSAYNKKSTTWVGSSTGPMLVSADNISHSIRYKASPSGVQTSSLLDYVFIYAGEFDLGTANNPIIIRDAKEYNDLFNGNAGKSANDNVSLSAKKAFGAYRLVNNLDLKSLIIDDGDETTTDYYNLSTTSITLTGEYRVSSNRPGTFDGNGLTISGLSITNSNSNNEQYFGMFKALQNGASISNIKVGVAKGGVNADRTLAVGAIAGLVEDSTISNIYVYNETPDEVTTVIGSHIVGGVAGIVAGNGAISSIRVENVSVTATYYETKGDNNNIPVSQQGDGVNTTISNLAKLSIAGGAFGIVHIYTQEQISKDIMDDDLDIRDANIHSVNVSGGMQVYGMTAGGVMGYAGKYVVARDISLTITKSDIPAKIVAYNYYAGGIVGVSEASLYQVKAEHEETWQKQIEEGIQTYYKGDLTFDRGQKDIFKDENLQYTPIAVGGIVGRMSVGFLRVAYSKINVDSSAKKYAGGVIGLIPEFPIGETGLLNVQITEVYAIGDVYAPNADYVSGVVGYCNQENVALSKVVALNMWSIGSCRKYGATENKIVVSQIINTDKEADLPIELDYCSTLEINETQETIKTVKFNSGENINIKVLNTEKDVTVTQIPAYYNYNGVSVDDGALISPAFTNIGWYDSGNWTKKSGELFPKIKYVTTTSVFEINQASDLSLIGIYGHNPDAVFVVMQPKLIDCSRWRTTNYGSLKGTLVGKYDTSGFTGLNFPIIKKLDGATISGLIFDHCIAPIAYESTGGTRINTLSYKDCTFSNYTDSTDKVFKNYGGVVSNILGNTQFEAINFIDCAISVDKKMPVNAGLLFAESDDATGTYITVSGIMVENQDKERLRLDGVKKDINIGFIFGKSNSPSLTLTNCSVYGTIEATVTGKEEINVNIGLVGGYAKKAVLFGVKINGISNADTRRGIYINSNNSNAKISIGGMIGYAEYLTLNNSNIGKTTIKTGSDITLEGEYTNAFVGGVAGIANSFESSTPLDANGEVVYGVNDSDKYCTITVDTPSVNEASLSVGGIIGQSTSIKEGTETVSPSTESTESEQHEINIKTLNYNGDIILNQIKYSNNSESTYVRVGGIIGYVEHNPSSTSTLSNVSFAGTISFADKKSNGNYYYVGGIIGQNNNSSLTIDNAYSIGDILVNNAGNYLNTTKSSAIGGIIGKTEKSITISNSVSLITLYGMHNNDNINYDAIGCLGGTDETTVKINCTNVYYASNINLCVSDSTDATNQTYGFITDATNPLLPSSLNGLFGSAKGTKLSPLSLSSFTMESQNNTRYDITVSENKILYESQYDNELRKLYVCLDESTKLENDKTQISLNNTFLFSDGGEIYTKATLFDEIDNKSAVSGITTRVYIAEDDKNSKAGFANINNGVIYTCYAGETYSKYSVEEIEESDPTLSNSNLYGVLTVNNANRSIGGFAGSNNGYIFGSHSNMHIQVLSQKCSIGGFVHTNSGVIEYSYAMGYATAFMNTSCLLDLFANKSSEDDLLAETNVRNCYSLFAPLVTTSTDLSGTEEKDDEQNNGFIMNFEVSNISNVAYEADAVEYCYEALGEDVNIYGEATFYSANKYYGCDKDYNYNYPALYNKFENMEYVRNSSYVYKHQITSNRSGIVTNHAYYVKDLSGTSNAKISIIPTATAFIKMTSGTSETSGTNNYVISRHFNFGYNGVEKAEAGEIENCRGTGDAVIGSLNNVYIDGQGYSIINLQLGEGNNGAVTANNGKNLIGEFGANATLHNLNFQNLTLYDSTGIIGVNYGTITGVTIGGNIAYSISTNNAYCGTLVGTNFGYIGTTAEIEEANNDYNIENKTLYGCMLNTNSLVGKNSKASTYYFGGLVGINDGTIKNISVNLNAVSVNEQKENPETGEYCVNNLYFGGIVGCLNGGVICGSGIETADVLIVSGDTVTVGGVVAFAVSGKIYSCYASGGKIQAGAEDKEDDHPATIQSNIGGIVGVGPLGPLESFGLEIYDCYNSADITAKAVWRFDDSNTNNNIRYVYDSELSKSVTVVMKCYSEAYAGGIISNYLTASNVANDGAETGGSIVATRLKNTGTVSGGFKAFKPIGMFYSRDNLSALDGLVSDANNVGSFFQENGLMVGAAVATGGTALAYAVTAAKAALAVPGVRWGAALVLVGLAIWRLWDYLKDACVAHLKFCPFDGTSYKYNSTTKNGIYTYNNLYGLTDFFTDSRNYFNANMVNWMWTWPMFSTSEYRGDFMGHKGSLKISKVSFDRDDITKSEVFNYEYYGAEIRNNYHPDDKQLCLTKDFENVTTNMYTELDYVDSVYSVYFDGICPSIVGANEDKSLMSSYKRITQYDTGAGVESFSLNCDNNVKTKVNSLLRFTDLTNINELLNSHYVSEQWTNVAAWDGQDLILALPQVLEPVSGNGEEGNNYKFVLTDSNLWRNLVYTINSSNNYQTEYTEIIIKTGDNIYVGSNSFNTFNGTMKFENNSNLYGYKPYVFVEKGEDKNKTNEYVGIIKQSTSAHIYNFSYSGNIYVANDDASNEDIVAREDNFTASFGLLIGQINGEVVIDNANIQNASITIPDNVSNRFKNVSMLVGEVANGIAEITNLNQSIYSVETLGTIIEFKDVASNNYSFGGVVAYVANGATVNIEKANVYVQDSVNIVSHINIAGGLIGNNNGTVSVKTTKAYIGKFNVASYKNTYVGGIIGYNNNALNVNGNVFVGGFGTKNSMLLSADVIKADKIAYAGGLIGYDEKTSPSYDETESPSYEKTFITIGNSNNSNTGNKLKIDKILAGYNSYTINKNLELNVLKKVVSVIVYYKETDDANAETTRMQKTIDVSDGNCILEDASLKDKIIDRVIINGKKIKTTDYSFDSENGKITINNPNQYAMVANEQFLRIVPKETHVGDIIGNNNSFTNKSYVITKNIVATVTTDTGDESITQDGASPASSDIKKIEDSLIDNNTFADVSYGENDTDKVAGSNIKAIFDGCLSETDISGSTLNGFVFDEKSNTIKNGTDESTHTITVGNLKTEYVYSALTNTPKVVYSFTITSIGELNYADENDEPQNATLTEEYLVKITATNNDFLIEIVFSSIAGTDIFAEMATALKDYKNSVIFSYNYSELKDLDKVAIPTLNNFLQEDMLCVLLNPNAYTTTIDSANIEYFLINQLNSCGMYMEFTKDKNNNPIIIFKELLEWKNTAQAIIYEGTRPEAKDITEENIDKYGFVEQIRFIEYYTRTFASINISTLTQNSNIFKVESTPEVDDSITYNFIINETGINNENDETVNVYTGEEEPITISGSINDGVTEVDVGYKDKNNEDHNFTLEKPASAFDYKGSIATAVFGSTGTYRGKNVVIISICKQDAVYTYITDLVYYSYKVGSKYSYVNIAELSYRIKSENLSSALESRNEHLIPEDAEEIATKYYNNNSEPVESRLITIYGLVYSVPKTVKYSVEITHYGSYVDGKFIKTDSTAGEIKYTVTSSDEYTVSFNLETNKIVLTKE